MQKDNLAGGDGAKFHSGDSLRSIVVQIWNEIESDGMHFRFCDDESIVVDFDCTLDVNSVDANLGCIKKNLMTIIGCVAVFEPQKLVLLTSVVFNTVPFELSRTEALALARAMGSVGELKNQTHCLKILISSEASCQIHAISRHFYCARIEIIDDFLREYFESIVNSAQ